MTLDLDAHVAVIGAGVIGASWTALFLAGGYDVVVADPATEAHRRIRDVVEQAWPSLTRLGLGPGASPDRLRVVTEAEEAATGATFVQESGPERLELKRDLMALIDRATPPGVVISSSSSGYGPTDLQAMCADHPERVVVGHPFHPAHLIPLVEVVRGRATAEWAMERTMEFYASLGKRPIRVNRELPGHVANRLQAAVWREAYSLVERGVVSVADVDAVVTNGPGIRWATIGPILGQHLSGGPGGLAHTLDHLGPPAQVWMDDLAHTQLTSELTRVLVAGVDAEIADLDLAAVVADRDALLVDILTRRRTTRLP